MPQRTLVNRIRRGLSNPKLVVHHIRTRGLARLDAREARARLARDGVHPESFLFLILDSCRWDTFARADAPNLKAIGEAFEGEAPGTFTFASHAAIWVGITPGAASSREPFKNPKAGRLFRLVNSAAGGVRADYIQMDGRNIVDGFRRLGYHTVGVGAMRWFDPVVTTGDYLTRDFDDFRFTGIDVRRQVDFVTRALIRGRDRKTFVFMNVGETHVPYWHKGAPWPRKSPCVPFATDNDAVASATRQQACLEFVDRELAPLLDAFTRSGASIYASADHGDAHGEDGLWGHGFYHEKVMKVPVVYHLRPRAGEPRDTGNEGVGVAVVEADM